VATVESTRSRRRQGRREELLDAADRVVRRGGREMSMDEVAAEAGITKPVLYRYFGDKDGLYEALAERYVDELKRELLPAAEMPGARARLAASIDAYLSYVEREPERYRFLLGAAERTRTAELVAAFRRERVERCASSATENLRRVGVEPVVGELWAHAVGGLVRETGVWWLETRALPRDQVVEHLTAVVWDAGSALRRSASGS
jgi:AcrR family transcriptional regulator